MTTRTSTEPLASGLRPTIELSPALLPEKGTYALVFSLDEATEFSKVGRYTEHHAACRVLRVLRVGARFRGHSEPAHAPSSR